MNLHRSLRLILCAAIALASAPLAAALPADVLAKNRWVVLTRADYDAALARVPQNLRYEFGTSPKRVQDFLNSLLLTKTLAAQARAHGTKPSLGFADEGNPAASADSALADAELKRVEEEAGRSFDTGKAQFEAKALEIYKANPDEYRTPDEVRLSDIPVLIRDRGDTAAHARAKEARAKLAAGADFATVAREYSDDPATRDKGGALPFMPAKSMAPELAKAAFALTRVGDVSEPVKAPSAYHVLRLDERRASRLRSFDEVRASIMDSLRKRHIAQQRDLRIQSIFRDPDTEANQAAIDALVNPVDPEIFRRELRKGKSAPADK